MVGKLQCRCRNIAVPGPAGGPGDDKHPGEGYQ